MVSGVTYSLMCQTGVLLCSPCALGDMTVIWDFQHPGLNVVCCCQMTIEFIVQIQIPLRIKEAFANISIGTAGINWDHSGLSSCLVTPAHTDQTIIRTLLSRK